MKQNNDTTPKVCVYDGSKNKKSVLKKSSILVFEKLIKQINKTMVKLSKKQLSEAIKIELREDNGLNEVFKLRLEGLMYLEREEFIKVATIDEFGKI